MACQSAKVPSLQFSSAQHRVVSSLLSQLKRITLDLKKVRQTHLEGVVAMFTTTVTSKGQVVIPASLRRKFRLHKGAKLGVSEEDGRIIMKVLEGDPIKEGRGMLTTRGAVLKQLVQDRLFESGR